MRATTLWSEMIILAMCLVLGANVMIQFVTMVSPSMLSYTEEKSALDTYDTISVYIDKDHIRKAPRYGKDLLLSLLNTDEYAYYPNAFKVDNSPIFYLNMEFQTMKATKLQQLYNVNGPYKLGSPAILNGEIKAVELEDDPATGKQFLHYYILTNP